jgi:hypothetical protein
MQQIGFGELKKTTKAGNLSPQELIQRLELVEAELVRVIRENYELRNLKVTDEQILFLRTSSYRPTLISVA